CLHCLFIIKGLRGDLTSHPLVGFGEAKPPQHLPLSAALRRQSRRRAAEQSSRGGRRPSTPPRKKAAARGAVRSRAAAAQIVSGWFRIALKIVAGTRRRSSPWYRA